MTDKQYLITEAQLALFKKVVGAAEGFHFIADRAMIIEADNMLQSLPMVDSEPVAHMYPWDLERFATNETTGHAYSVAVGCPDGKSVPLYTSPQALTKITAADITPEMHQEWNKIFRVDDMSIPKDGEIMAAAYNAVIKHKSEAK